MPVVLSYCISYILLGLCGMVVFPIAAATTVVLVVIFNRALAVMLVVAGVILTLVAVPNCGESGRRARDVHNVQQIAFAVQSYREDHSVYPDQLSKLQKHVGRLDVFASPRDPGAREWFAIGPLQMWNRKHNPGHVQRYRNWLEINEGDYLYRKPDARAPSNMIVIMTRPGLLYLNGVSVGYVDGHVEYYPERMWKNRNDTAEFLTNLGLTNYLSLSTGN